MNQENLADEICHITYEALHNDLAKYEIKHFKSWLYTVTKNICLKYKRNELSYQKTLKKYVLDEDFIEYQSNQDLLKTVLKEKHLNKLEDCLKKLKPEQRKSIELFYLQDSTYQDVNQKLQYGLKKVKSYIQNGKRNLKNCIERSE